MQAFPHEQQKKVQTAVHAQVNRSSVVATVELCLTKPSIDLLQAGM